MPAPIDDATRSEIVYLAALGYSRSEIAETVSVSRTTVRKYLDRARETVETDEDPRETLCSILRNDHDWVDAEKPGPDIDGTEFLSM